MRIIGYLYQVPTHTAFFVICFLVRFKGANDFSVALQSSEFLFVSEFLKTFMKTHRFESVNKIKMACTQTLKDIPEEAYRDPFNVWKSRWKRCIDASEDYFESF